MAYLAAMLRREGHEVFCIDAAGEAIGARTPIDEEHGLDVCGLTAPEIVARIPAHTKLIGISCIFTSEWIYCRKVIEAITAKFPHVPIVMGGEHVTAAAHDIMAQMPQVTACVLGEGEECLLELVEAGANTEAMAEIKGIVYRSTSGEIMATPPRSRVRRLDELPWPDWNGIPIERYLEYGHGYGVTRGRVMPMLASRGCPYRCTFCSNPGMWGKLWNVRSPADVVAEMKYYVEHHGVTHITFWDLTMVIRKEWMIEFMQLLRKEKLGVEWSIPSGTRSESLDAEVASLMLETGCRKMTFAPESGSKEELLRIQKKVHLDTMLSKMRIFSKTGLIVKAHIIFGFPDSTLKDVLLNYWFLVKMAWVGVNDCPIYLFHPYPGSALHHRLKAEGAFPADIEEYDRMMALSVSNNYRQSRSWNHRFSARTLARMGLLGMAIFYSSQFLFRPWRLGISLYRSLRSEPVTMLERMPEIFLSRFTPRDITP
jgi:anaerobic magnesium-protoporphyrin IX monomethyl ester cyclase